MRCDASQQVPSHLHRRAQADDVDRQHQSILKREVDGDRCEGAEREELHGLASLGEPVDEAQQQDEGEHAVEGRGAAIGRLAPARVHLEPASEDMDQLDHAIRDAIEHFGESYSRRIRVAAIAVPHTCRLRIDGDLARRRGRTHQLIPNAPGQQDERRSEIQRGVAIQVVPRVHEQEQTPEQSQSSDRHDETFNPRNGPQLVDLDPAGA
jgi:hypothetical protein